MNIRLIVHYNAKYPAVNGTLADLNILQNKLLAVNIRLIVHYIAKYPAVNGTLAGFEYTAE